MRIQTTIPDSLCDEIDKRAEAQGITRSNYVLNAINFKIQYDDMMALMPKMSDMIDKAKESGLLEQKNGG